MLFDSICIRACEYQQWHIRLPFDGFAFNAGTVVNVHNCYREKNYVPQIKNYGRVKCQKIIQLELRKKADRFFICVAAVGLNYY